LPSLIRRLPSAFSSLPGGLYIKGMTNNAARSTRIISLTGIDLVPGVNGVGVNTYKTS
jgi:hypothetical protein